MSTVRLQTSALIHALCATFFLKRLWTCWEWLNWLIVAVFSWLKLKAQFHGKIRKQYPNSTACVQIVRNKDWRKLFLFGKFVEDIDDVSHSFSCSMCVNNILVVYLWTVSKSISKFWSRWWKSLSIGTGVCLELMNTKDALSKLVNLKRYLIFPEFAVENLRFDSFATDFTETFLEK